MTRSRTAILNGKTAEEEEVKAALELLVADETPTDVVVTRAAGDAARYAYDAAVGGADEIVVFGGDGTLSGLATGLSIALDEGHETRAIVGIVPTGTANDFASAAGLVAGDPPGAVRAMSTLQPVALDVGHGGSGAFLNVVTAGFGSEISSSVTKEMKAVLGRVAYLVSAVTQVTAVEPRVARIRADGFDEALGFYLLAIGNGRCAGGGIPVCPDASAVDGLFDVTIVPEGKVGTAIAEVVQQGLSGIGEAGIRIRTPWIEIETESPLQVNLDGEGLEGTRFRFEVRPSAMRVLLPADSPLLGASRPPA